MNLFISKIRNKIKFQKNHITFYSEKIRAKNTI